MRVLWQAVFALVLLGWSWQSPAAADSTLPSSSKHCAWELKGSNVTVHLLGSVHVLKEESYPLPQVFEAAFSNARVVVFETDIGEVLKPEAQVKFARAGMYPPGETLRDHLSTQTYEGLTNQIARSGAPEQPILHMKPANAMTMLVMHDVAKHGYKPEAGMDIYFYKHAKEQRKTVLGLETLDEQLHIINDLTDAQGEALVKSTLTELADAGARFDALLTAWRTGDEAGLEKILNEASRDEPELMRRFTADRNVRWVPTIETLARGTNDAVVVVGAGHLVGTDSLVDLLRQRGWRVTQK